MNSEEKVLEILAQIQLEQKSTNERLLRIETDTAAAKVKMSLLQMDVSDIKSGQAEQKAGYAKLQEDITEIKESVKYIWEDLGRLGDRLNEHDVIIQKRVM